MSNFVCSGAKWSCTFGGCGTIATEKSNIKIDNKCILTTKNKPSSIGSGVCSAQSGAPCSPKPTSWQKVSKVECGVSNIPLSTPPKALLSNSFIPCAMGGIIRIQKPCP